MRQKYSKCGYIILKRLPPHSMGRSVCGENRTHGLERAVEGQPSTATLQRRPRWRNENEETSLLSLKAELFLGTLSGESSQAELCRRHNLSEDQLSKWKQQVVENVGSLFVSTEQQSSEAAGRIAHLEQLVGRLTVALDIQKKAATWLDQT